MSNNELTGQTAAKEVKSKLGLINALTTFVVITLLAIIAKSIYEPVGKYLDFIPDLSVAVIMLIVAILTLVSVSFSRVFSRQVVSSIENYSRSLDSVLNVTREIREEIYGDILLERIMEHSLSLTGSEAGSILLVDGNELEFKIVKGGKADELLGRRITAETGVGGWVVRHGSPLYIHDVSKDDRFDAHVDDATGFRTKSILAVPLISKGRTIGVIELLNKKSGKYSGKDIDLVSYLADQTAISLERAKFYEDQRNYEIHLTDILLDTIDRFVPEKKGHSKRVARYASIIARSIKMPDERARRLYYASLLHDIGFIRLPMQKFDDPKINTQHPRVGYEMLKPVNFYKDIAPFILYHHERYDGKGYPKGLVGARIPLESRIIAIAEAFDAMVSRCSYKPAMSYEAAIQEIKSNAGKQFDGALAEHFVRNITDAAVE